MGGSVRRLGAALRYVTHVDSWLTLAVLGALIAVLDQIAAFPLPGAVLALPIAQATWAAYFYLTLHKASTGSRRLPRLLDYRDTWNTFWAPLFRGAIVGLGYALPLAVVVVSKVGLRDFVERLHASPLALLREDHGTLYAFLALELVYLPAALLASCAPARFWHLFDPSFGLRYALRLGDRYVAVFFGICVLVLASFLASSAATALAQVMPIPLVSSTIGQVFKLWVPLAEARLLGDLAFEAASIRDDR